MARISGSINIKRDGTVLRAKGSFGVRPEVEKEEMIEDINGIPGSKVMAQTSLIEGEIFVTSDADFRFASSREEATIQVELANGTTYVMPAATYTEEGKIDTEEGGMPVKYESRLPMRAI